MEVYSITTGPYTNIAQISYTLKFLVRSWAGKNAGMYTYYWCHILCCCLMSLIKRRSLKHIATRSYCSDKSILLIYAFQQIFTEECGDAVEMPRFHSDNNNHPHLIEPPFLWLIKVWNTSSLNSMSGDVYNGKKSRCVGVPTPWPRHSCGWLKWASLKSWHFDKEGPNGNEVCWTHFPCFC